MAGSNTSDAIVVGEDWISEHYFATDGKQSFQAKVLERRKEWDEAARADTATVKSRFTTARSVLLSTFSTFGEEGGRYASLPGLYQQLREILGYTTVALQSKRVGPVEWIHATGLEATASLALIEAIAVKDVEALMAKGDPLKPSKRDRTLLEPYGVDEKTQIHSVARLLSHLFVQDDAPDFALVLAGAWALVAEKERWAEGRYLAVNLQVVAERADDKRGGETDRALTCLEAKSVAPDPEGNLWWPGILDESVKHTVGVSKDLREGVRLSIEIIANEVVRRRAAQGLDPLPQTQAQDLARHSLRYLYRILFLLLAEASPELGVLPVGDPAYERGYSLDRLRELTLVEIAGPRAEDGTHLYQSLATLFHLVDQGHDGATGAARQEIVDGNVERVDDGEDGLTFNPLKADLFLEKATKLIDEVGLGNRALQRVLSHLLLSKESKGKDRGFISYAELGINQLGAVYEGLMSYTGFFAEEDLHEVAKGGDNEKGSWVVPTTRSQSIAPGDFVKYPDPHTGERKPVVHEKGTFVFRLAGRERQQSASYYTPEVLTRFTVGQALVELIGPDSADETSVEWAGREIPRRMTAPEILDLTVCEPALGSGAFAIEAVQQLAAAYLKRRQEELDVRIDPDDFQHELQKVKAYIALHNVYGVDLNATAVELAEISLWLDTMGEGLQAPWFGLHLRRGNSLIGARRAVFRRDQLAKRARLKEIPTDKPLLERAAGKPVSVDGGIHHFLLPATGWGSAVDAKEAKELAPDALKALKEWRKSALVAPSKEQANALADLASRVEALWTFATERLRIAESHVRRHIDVWGADDLPTDDAVSREQVEAYLADPTSAYRRLRRVMDAWCALWFWPLTDRLTRLDDTDAPIEPPSLGEWIATLRDLLGTAHESSSSGRGRTWRGGDQTLAQAADWDSLDAAEALDAGFAGAQTPDAVLAKHPWLRIAERIADRQGFFHWELDFARVFADRGGFDLQVGNPPWVRPSATQDDLLAESDPRWQLDPNDNFTKSDVEKAQTLARPGAKDLFVDAIAASVSILEYLNNSQNYAELEGVQGDLYRNFIVASWRNSAAMGVSALIHSETHFTEGAAGAFRELVYGRLRRHYGFINQKKLFEIGNTRAFGICVYGDPRAPGFIHAAKLFHPDTASRSLLHDGTGPEPGVKDNYDQWNLYPHRRRVIHVNDQVLRGWRDLLDNAEPSPRRAPMLFTVNQSANNAAVKLGRSNRVEVLGLSIDGGLQETASRRSGITVKKWGRARDLDGVVLQGSQIEVANPYFQEPNPSMSSHRDFTEIDLEGIDAEFLPATGFKLGEKLPPSEIRSSYRVAWRNMADNVGQERTLKPAILAPQVAHIHTITSATVSDSLSLATLAGVLSSIVSDFSVRLSPRSTISGETVMRLPMPSLKLVGPLVALRALRLNALTEAYADLWRSAFSDEFLADSWAEAPIGSPPALGEISREWSERTPLRRSAHRRQAQIEIDVLVAIALDLSADELCAVYRSEFPVLVKYDRRHHYYDVAGRRVPSEIVGRWKAAQLRDHLLDASELSDIHPLSGRTRCFVPPFATLNREDSIRNAFRVFENRLSKSGGAARNPLGGPPESPDHE